MTKPEELRRLNPLVSVLAEWEDANGTMACILPNEWSDLRQAVMDACVDQSPRMLRNALREYADILEREPKPYLYVYEYDTPFGMHRSTYPGLYNGKAPTRTVPLFTHPPRTEPPKMTEAEVGDIWFDLDGEASRLFLRKLNAFADAICDLRDKQWGGEV